MNAKDSDEERQLGTIGSELNENINNLLINQYKRLPEDFRTGLEEGTAANVEAIRQWNVQKRKENTWGGIGPLDPLIGAVDAYSAVAEPVKKELSIRTGLDLGLIDKAEIAADVLTPGIPLAKKKYKQILDIIDSSPFQVPNPFKRAAQTWDDFTYMIGGGIGTGTGVGPGDIRPKKITKKYAPGTAPPAPEPGWTQKAQDAQYPRLNVKQRTEKGNLIPKTPFPDEVDEIIERLPLSKGVTANIDQMRIMRDLKDIPFNQREQFRNEIVNFLNQADEYAKTQIAYDKNVAKPLSGFEYVNLDGVNTGGRSLIDPLGRVWTVRRPTKNKGWQFKNYADLDSYRANRTRYDITSNAEEALARRRLDAYKVEQNKALKARKDRLNKKGAGLTLEEKQWIENNKFIEFYGEHIRRLSRGNPYWRTPEFLKGTMKSGDVANYKIFSNQIEKKFKDQIETILYGKTSGKHYGARYGKTGNELTLGMTNDLTELTIEEILPNGRLKQLGRIPLSRAYEEGVDFKDILKEIIGEPPPVIDITYKPVGNKSIPVIRRSAAEIIEEAFSKPRFKDLTKTSERNVERMKRMKGGGTIE